MLHLQGRPRPPAFDDERFGLYALDREKRELSRDGAPIPLTDSEPNLLQVLVGHPNLVLDRDQIFDLLKGYERSPFPRAWSRCP